MRVFHLFTYKDIPVGVHPFFLLLIFVLSIGAPYPVIFALCAVCAVLFHEFGHALVARKYHLGPQIILHGMGGVTMHALPASAKQDFRITFAGPLAGLVIGGLFFAVAVLFGSQLLVIHPYLFLFVQYMGYINLAWGFFNLLPVQPMDGSKVLIYLLSKFMRPKRVMMTSSVISMVLAASLLIYFLIQGNIFMILIGGYLCVISYTMIREAFSGDHQLEGGRIPKASLEAERAYERGLVAARDHDWKSLETYGHQMKKNANDSDQMARAYEFLTIACTNMGRYEEALVYSKDAKQSDSVKQAVLRCRTMLK